LPEFLKPCISLLTVHLDGDSPSMRKCVLGVLSEILMKVLTKEDMTDTDRDDRDNFLDCLEDHLHDVHAHVRYYFFMVFGQQRSIPCVPC
jgi:condensin complex subunit 1